MKYKSLEEIEAVIKSFEESTVERGNWGHPEHLILAYHYAINHDFDTAYEKMKAGIFRLLEAFGVDTAEEMPYHETMTVFWLKTVYDYAEKYPGMSLEEVDELIKRFDKYYPGEFYSKELLMSDRARAEYVKPDLKTIDD